MKSLFLCLAALAITTSCELRSTSFDPDEQLVTEDELAQIALWDQYQEENQSTADYERENAEEFVGVKFDARKNTSGEWVIEGAIRNAAKKFAIENHLEFVELSFLWLPLFLPSLRQRFPIRQ